MTTENLYQEHLPECYAVTHRDTGDDRCICDRLHDCEARVRDEATIAPSTLALIENHALDLAREAVAGIPHTYWEGIAMCRASHPSYTEDDCNCPKRDALAAIDALRGESNG